MKTRNAKVLAATLIVLGIALLANLCLGASGVSAGEILRALVRGEKDSVGARILMYVRLPRALAAMLAGSALACAGMTLQKVLRNPLAAPGVIGVNSGAGLFALVVMAFFPEMTGLAPLAAFAGAVFAVFAVYLLARLTGASRFAIVLAGVAVNSLLGAAMDAIVTIVPDAAVSRSAFSIGGFSMVSMNRLLFALPFWAAGLMILLAFQREMQLMQLGDDVSKSLGLRVEAFRAVFLVAAAMLAGAAVSFAGLLGFVGLIAPHMTNLMLKNDARLQTPVTAAFGAALCLVCDLIARTAFAPYELPVGVVLSFLGAPFFLWLLIRRKRSNRHDSD